MKDRVLGLLIAMAVPAVASAQTEALDYQGYVMGGTSSVLAPSYMSGTPIGGITLTKLSTTATFDAQVTFSGSVAQNDLLIVSYQVDVTAINGNSFAAFTNLGGGFVGDATLNSGGALCYTTSASVAGCINLTTSGGAVTGAVFNMSTEWLKAPNIQFAIGPDGDAFSYYVPPVSSNGCHGSTFYTAVYIGPANAPCAINVGNPTAGVWSVKSLNAPEIDPSSAASGLTLLLGSLLVLRGRGTT